MNRRAPLKLEQAFTANQAAPTAGVTTQSHVFPLIALNTDGTPTDDEIARFLMIKGRFTAVAGDAAATIVLWAFDADALQWYASALMNLKNVSDIETGGMLLLDGPFGSTHGAFEVAGLGDGDNIKLTVRQQS